MALKKLSSQVGAILVICITLSMMSFTWFAVDRFSSISENSLLVQARIMVAHLANVANSPILHQEYTLIEEMLVNSGKFPNVKNIIITDSNGNVFSEVEVLEEGEVRPTYQPGNVKPPKLQETVSNNEKGNLVIWSPIIRGSLVGWARVTYSMAGVFEIRALIWKTGIFALILGIAASMPILLWFMKSRIMAINAATGFANSLNKNKGQLIPVTQTSIELYDLLTALNKASLQLFESSEALESSEKRHRSLVEATSSIIWTTDASGGFATPQYSWEKFTGQPWGEHKGSGWAKKIHPDDIERIQKVWKKAVREQSLYATWGRVWNANLKEWRDFETEAIPIKKPDGSLSEWVGVMTDITERKKAEEALLESELWMRSIFNSLDEGVLVVTPDRRFVNVNEAAQRIFGYSTGELKNLPTETLHVDHQHYVEFGQRIARAFEKGQTANFEFEFKRKDGEVFPAENTVSLLKNPAGEPIGIASVVKDITERKRAEEALRESEEKFRVIFNKTPVSIILMDEHGRMSDVNPYHIQNMGKGKTTKKDYVGKSLIKHPSIVNSGLSRIYEGLLEGKSFDIQDVYFPTTTGGTAACFNVRGVPIFSEGKVVGAITTHEDITEHKRAEEELINSKKQMELFSLITTNMLWNWDLINGTVERSIGFERAFGYRKEDITTDIEWWIDRLHPDDKDRVMSIYSNTVETGGLTCSYEYRFRSRDGSYANISDNAYIVRNKDGKAIRSLGAMTDITERKRAEEELQESEERFRSLVETSHDLIWRCDSEGRFNYLNPAWESTHGYKVGEMLGRKFTEFQTPEVAARDIELFKSHIDGGMSTGYETTHIAKSGKTIHLSFNARFLMDLNGNIIGTQGTAQDLTERKMAEEELKKKTDLIRLLNEISLAANEASTVEEAMQVCLDKVCDYTGWEVGHAYVLGFEDTLVPTELWRIDDPHRFKSFREKTKSVTFTPGVGLPGRVLESGKPVWIPDVTKDRNFLRAKVAAETGLKAGFAFPVLEGKKVVAVLTFFTTERVEADESLLNAIENLATQLGRVTERKSMEILREQFSRNLVESTEHERKRISSDIHDGIGQQIVVIRSGIQKCLKIMSIDRKAVDILNQISSITEQTMDEVREIISNLHPHQLDQLGLKGAIISSISQVDQSTDIKFFHNIQDIDGILSKNHEIQLYRIIQEGIKNIVKHSDAAKSTITIRKTKNSINIKIKDDGKGFVFDSYNTGYSGLGLAGISERAKILGGVLKVDSLRGTGTTLEIKIPLIME